MVPIIIESEKFCKAISWFIPVGAITLCPFIICRDKSDKVMLNHESIHVKQQLELLVIPFFLIYLLNWLYNLVKYRGDTNEAYMQLFFEKEAYDHEYDMEYLSTRQKWSCFRSKS